MKTALKTTCLVIAMGATAGCDRVAEWVDPVDPATRYERRGDILFDTATGLTYDAAAADAEREVYREMLEARGEDMPGVPLVLAEDQREELYASTQWANHRAQAARSDMRMAARRAEWVKTCEEVLPRFEGEGAGANFNGIAELMRQGLVQQCLDAVEARFADAKGASAPRAR